LTEILLNLFDNELISFYQHNTKHFALVSVTDTDKMLLGLSWTMALVTAKQ